MKFLYSLNTSFLVLFSLSISVFSQEKMIARDGFKEGYRAIQFGIGSNFRLTNFSDANFSFLRFKSASKTYFLRGYLETHYSNSEDERNDSSPFPSTNIDSRTLNRSINNESFITELKVYLGSINYINTNSDILPFVSKSIFMGSLLNTGNSNTQEELDRENEGLNFRPSLGLNLGFGVDYFIAKNISINAQSGIELSYLYNWNKNEDNFNETINGEFTRIQKNDRSTTSHDFILQTTGVLFGLTAYF